MPYSETAIAKFVKENNGGVFQELYGPFRIGDSNFWEVWTRQGTEFQTRFVIECANQELIYLSTFAALANHLDGVQIEERKLSQAHERHLQKFTRYVAAIAFLLTVSAALYLVIAKNDVGAIVSTVVIGLVASGSTLFFGKWVTGSNNT